MEQDGLPNSLHEGEKFELTCAVTYPNVEGNMFITWFFKEQRIRDFGNNTLQDKFFRTVEREGYSKRNLVIRRSKISHTGIFKCRVSATVNGVLRRIHPNKTNRLTHSKHNLVMIC